MVVQRPILLKRCQAATSYCHLRRLYRLIRLTEAHRRVRAGKPAMIPIKSSFRTGEFESGGYDVVRAYPTRRRNDAAARQRKRNPPVE